MAPRRTNAQRATAHADFELPADVVSRLALRRTPEDGLTKKLLENADEETKMLLGVGGYLPVAIAAAQVPSREYFSGGKEHVETGAHKEQATK